MATVSMPESHKREPRIVSPTCVRRHRYDAAHQLIDIFSDCAHWPNTMAQDLRLWLRERVRSWPWIPVAVLACALAVLLIALTSDAPKVLTIFVTVCCLGCAFVWGYTVHLARQWPRLHGLRRSQYSAVWDSLSLTSDAAAFAATGYSDESSLQTSGKQVATRIAAAISLKASDDVLEIGCGVGRVGWAVAPECRSWIGCDISKTMLLHARRRLAGLSNVRFVHLHEANLGEIPDASIDIVYCTNMLAHLDPMERWQYVMEAHRVLRPSGRIYVDTIALDSPEGWAMLANNLEQRKSGVEAPYIPIPSTTDELIAYGKRAGFAVTRTEQRDSLLIMTANKTMSIQPVPTSDNSISSNW
jgi:ubiquinone/menaquinone biosynthesis C-methylase UbiE